MEPLTRTLSASAYTSRGWYELEKRSVFRKSWYLLGPIARFEAIGEKVKYEFAGFKIFATRMSKAVRDINVETEDGSKVRSHLTSETGLLFATPSNETEEFDDYFPELKELVNKVDFTKRPYRRPYDYYGNFNWKTMVDGYQECLHCQYAHKKFCEMYDVTFYKVKNFKNFSQHVLDPEKTDVTKEGLFLHFFPNCTLQVYAGGMSTFRFCPTDNPIVTHMEFDYFHADDLLSAEFAKYLAFVKRVAREDRNLCRVAQENINLGIYDTGILNSDKESGVIHYQKNILRLVLDQYEVEKSTTLSQGTVDSSKIAAGGNTSRAERPGQEGASVHAMLPISA